MLVLVLIDVLVLLDGMLAQTCRPTFRPVCNYQDQRLDSYQISHLMNFTLQRCALECLLVKKCASFNHRNTSGICELNNVSLTVVGVESLEHHTGFQHYDIRDWDPVIAGTCASRPCAENQRCLQTTPFTCVVVDCGLPRRYSQTMPASRVRLTSAPTVTTIGSTAVYDCNDPLFIVSYHPTDLAPFLNRSTKICNSDFSWSINEPRCLNDCGSPPTVDWASVVTSPGTWAGSTATYNCTDGSTFTSTCADTGSWGATGSCPADCGPPPTDENASFVNSTGTWAGSTATYSRVTTYVTVFNISICNDTGSWVPRYIRVGY